jgi:hypothetical protein
MSNGHDADADDGVGKGRSAVQHQAKLMKQEAMQEEMRQEDEKPNLRRRRIKNKETACLKACILLSDAKEGGSRSPSNRCQPNIYSKRNSESQEDLILWSISRLK